MVKKGLQEGDVFEDGGWYRVKEVLPDGNYISERTEAPGHPGDDAIESAEVPTEEQDSSSVEVLDAPAKNFVHDTPQKRAETVESSTTRKKPVKKAVKSR